MNNVGSILFGWNDPVCDTEFQETLHPKSHKSQSRCRNAANSSVFVCWKQLLGVVGIKWLDMEQWGFSSAFSRICFVFLCSPTFISPFKQFSFSCCLLHPDKNNIIQQKKVERKTKTEREKKYCQERARGEILRRFKGGDKGWTNWNIGSLHLLTINSTHDSNDVNINDYCSETIGCT